MCSIEGNHLVVQLLLLRDVEALKLGAENLAMRQNKTDRDTSAGLPIFG